MKIILSTLLLAVIAISLGQTSGGDDPNAGYTVIGHEGPMSLSTPTNLTLSSNDIEYFSWSMLDWDSFIVSNEPEGAPTSRRNTTAEFSWGWQGGSHPGITLGNDPDHEDVTLKTGYTIYGKVKTENAEPGYYFVRFSYTDFSTGVAEDPGEKKETMQVTVN